MRSPDQIVSDVKTEAKKEFRDILWQVIGQRTDDAIESLARMSQPEVAEKLKQTSRETMHECMVDLAVAREAAGFLQDITEGKS